PAEGMAEEAGDPDPRIAARLGQPVDVLAAPVPELDEVEPMRRRLARPLGQRQVGPHELDRDGGPHAGPIVAPPFTSKVWPVTIRAAGLHRYATASAMSVGRIGTWRHWPLATRSRYSSDTVCVVISVVTRPGATPLTAMPDGPSSRAMLRVIPITAAFEAT